MECFNCLAEHFGAGVVLEGKVFCSEGCLIDWEIEQAAEKATPTLEDAYDEPSKDVGEHYRKEWQGKPLDPYRIADIYGFTGGPREHLLEKVLRGVDKGNTGRELVNELSAIVKRWGEMLDEDS